jgi:hypothetical protein
MLQRLRDGDRRRGTTRMRCATWPTIPTILVAACGVSPAAPTAHTAVAVAPSAVARPAVAPSSIAPAPIATTTEGTGPTTAPSANLREFARHAGYQLRTVNGQQIFCHDETSAGTRFAHRVCLTSEALALRLQGIEDVKTLMRVPGRLEMKDH